MSGNSGIEREKKMKVKTKREGRDMEGKGRELRKREMSNAPLTSVMFCHVIEVYSHLGVVSACQLFNFLVCEELDLKLSG